LGQALEAWLLVLAKRRNEEGYTDNGAAVEAARLAEKTADAMMAERKRREGDE